MVSGKTKRSGVAAALATATNVETFVAALEHPENKAILDLMKDKRRGKMTDEAIRRGKALAAGARAALEDTAAGKAELPNVTTEVLARMGECHEAIQMIATHVRGYLRENEAGLPKDEVERLLASFNGLIDGSTSQAGLPARLRAVVAAGRQDPNKSAMAKLMRDAGFDEEDFDDAERTAGVAVTADVGQEIRKGGKVTTVAAKDSIAASLRGWYSRWSEVAYKLLPEEQQAVLGLPRRAKRGRRPKRGKTATGDSAAPK